MLNIIEHLWQFQAQNIETLSTVIASKNDNKNKTNFYFYSDKKARILRKKNNQVKDILQYCQQLISLKNQLTILSFSCKNNVKQKIKTTQKLQNQHKRSNFVQISLTSYNDLSACLHQNNQAQLQIQTQKSFQQVFVILPSQCLNYEKNGNQGLVNSSFYAFYNFKISSNRKSSIDKTIIRNIEIEQENSFTNININKLKLIQTKNTNKICQVVQTWIKQIQNKANKWFSSLYTNFQQIIIDKFQGLLMVKYQNGLAIDFKLIWCFVFFLRFKHSDMHKISSHDCEIFNFSYLPLKNRQKKQKNENQEKELCHFQPNIKKEFFMNVNQSQSSQSSNKLFNQQKKEVVKAKQTNSNTTIQKIKNSKQIKCWACQKICCQQNYKQVPNEDIIALRRLNSLSIRGLAQEYYQICIDCYQTLDDL